MNNLLKNEEGEFIYDPFLLIGLIKALQIYQNQANIGMNTMLLKFKDYMLEISYSNENSPIIGVLIEGKSSASITGLLAAGFVQRYFG